MSVNRATAKRSSGARRERGPAWHRRSTRAAILDAVRSLVARDGVDRLSLNRVAQEAGFAPATVYAYFVKKADLVTAVVADDMAAFARLIKDEFSPADESEAAAAAEPSQTDASTDQMPQDATPVSEKTIDTELTPVSEERTAIGGADSAIAPLRLVLVEPANSDDAETGAVREFDEAGPSGQPLDPSEPNSSIAHDEPQNASEPVSAPAIGSPLDTTDVMTSLAARISQLESRRVDAWLERRLREFERLLATLEDRTAANERAQATAPIEGGLQDLRQRLDALERQFESASAEQAKSFAEKLETTESRLRQSVADLRTRTLEISSRLDNVERDQDVRALAEEMPAAEHSEIQPVAKENSAKKEPLKIDRTSLVEGCDDSYLVAARRAALAAQSLAQGDSKDEHAVRNRIRTRLFVGLCVGLGVALAGTGLVLKHSIAVEPWAGATANLPAPSTAKISQVAQRQPMATTVMYPTPEADDTKTLLTNGLAYLDSGAEKGDDTRAADLIAKAAMRGEPVAQYWLGTLYEHGRGVAADPGEAIRWYEASALQGNLKAMYKLGVFYAEGWGSQRNYGEAARWFSRAAEMGYINAQFNLAVLYERGLGVPQSLLDAYKWYAIAAAQGDRDSASRVDALSSQISAEDLATARQSVSAFKPEPRQADANDAPIVPQTKNATAVATAPHSKSS